MGSGASQNIRPHDKDTPLAGSTAGPLDRIREKAALKKRVKSVALVQRHAAEFAGLTEEEASSIVSSKDGSMLVYSVSEVGHGVVTGHTAAQLAQWKTEFAKLHEQYMLAGTDEYQIKVVRFKFYLLVEEIKYKAKQLSDRRTTDWAQSVDNKSNMAIANKIAGVPGKTASELWNDYIVHGNYPGKMVSEGRKLDFEDKLMY